MIHFALTQRRFLPYDGPMNQALKILLKKIDHIGIAVESLQSAVPVYTALTGHAPEHFEEVTEQKVKAAFFSVGESNI